MSYLLWHYLADAAERNDAGTAVSSSDGSMTYRELVAATDCVARALVDTAIGPGSRVGICLPKSHRAVAAMLGVLKAGAAYVPVDAAAPPRRGAFILEDCSVRCLITTHRLLHIYRKVLADLAGVELVILADDPAPDHDRPEAPPRVLRWDDLPIAGPTNTKPGIETDPAYLLYTSGSTGNPKGVILSHRHARTFVDWGGSTFGIEASDRLSNHAPFHFDLSVFDIYVALRAGACVALVPEMLAPFPTELARWIDEESITTWYSVPSALVRLLLHGRLDRFQYAQLRHILFAGEVFPIKYLRELMKRIPGADYYNLYGPTETNVCTYYRVPAPLPPEAKEIPIGTACANTEVFALDDSGREVVVGEMGELCVRGPAVMTGYWGLPERTLTSRVDNPLQAAYREPVYRTGDLVRKGTDDVYYFVGRRDHMVKSRGHRIELGDIEQALHSHPMVREAAVFAVPDEEVGARLHAAVAAASGSRLRSRELHAFCMDQLPRYMVPESFVLLDELPKTSTGKIDRIALERTHHESFEEERAP